MSQKPKEPFVLAYVRTDGYAIRIEEVAGLLELVVRRVSDGRSWRGVCNDVEMATSLAAKIVEDQKLITQMMEGDRNAAH